MSSLNQGQLISYELMTFQNECLKQCISQMDFDIRDMQTRYDASFEEVRRIESSYKNREMDLKNEVEVLSMEVTKID